MKPFCFSGNIAENSIVKLFFVAGIGNSIQLHWRRTLVQYIFIELLLKRRYSCGYMRMFYTISIIRVSYI